MNAIRLPSVVAVAALAALAALLLPAAAQAESRASKIQPPRAVLGAGTIDVSELVVRSAPRRSAAVVARLPEFRPQDFRPSVVLATAQGGPDRSWVKISVPGRPNGRTGWVRKGHVSLKPMPWQVVVYRDSRRIQLWKGDKLVHAAKVAVGAPGMETPTGLFYVTMRFRPVRQTFLGTFAFETSAYSKLSDWPGGGVVGVHGTWQPSLLGRAVSHGCVRVSNETANVLRDRIPVGTPVRVLPA